MRNYISTFWQEWNVHYDDGGGGQGDYTLHGVGKDRKDLAAYVQQLNDQQSVLNPGFTFTFSYPNDPFQSYWLLDKENFVSLWRYNVLPDVGFVIAQGTAAGLPKITQVNETPRYSGWKDVDGSSRKAPPSDKKGSKSNFAGEAGLIAAAAGLLAYSDALAKAGDKRDAVIVKFAYDNVFNGTWSITEAFDYLRKNGLL